MGSKRIKPGALQVSKIIEKQDCSDLIDFDTWFYKKMKEDKFRVFQRSEVRVYLNELGLKNVEKESTFDDKIKSF